MKRVSGDHGYLLVDVIVGLSLFGFVLVSVYAMYQPTFVLSGDFETRLSVQQDVRLALDRVARTLHETTTAFGRFRVYPAEAGCSGAYEGCLGLVTAREANCRGAFQLINGRPNWQATVYLWRDTASNELRVRCDPSTTFPVVIWPPRTLAPYVVVGTHVVRASVTAQGAAGAGLPRIAIALQERVPGRSRRSSTTFFSETLFLPQNP